MANHTGKGISDRKLAITPPILPDEAPVTQAMDTMGTGDEAGAGLCVPAPASWIGLGQLARLGVIPMRTVSGWG